MIKVSQKKNQSCIQVIKTLQVLLENNYTILEIVDKLNMKEKEPVFNQSTVCKYINTCRFCGFSIPKINNKYYMSGFPFGIELTLNEIDLIKFLFNEGKEFLTKRKYDTFTLLMEKLNRLSKNSITSIGKNSHFLPHEIFENAITIKRKVNLIFKTGLSLTCIPLKIIEINGKTYFNILYKNKERMINTKRLSGIYVTNEKYIQPFNDKKVIYELRGNLAKRYEIRPHETILESYDDRIVISNRGEYKDILLSRLLRYDNLCKIISPESYRNDMKNIVRNALENYGIK